MGKYIISLQLILFSAFIAAEKDDEKTNFQVLADKEKELNDREARIRLKEIELEEREKKLNLFENGQNPLDTSLSQTDTSKTGEEKSEKKELKEIQKQITKKFENPTTTVKDYYEYIQRAINDRNFERKYGAKYFRKSLKINLTKTQNHLLWQKNKSSQKMIKRCNIRSKTGWGGKERQRPEVAGYDSYIQSYRKR
jgi:hypothetical protein